MIPLMTLIHHTTPHRWSLRRGDQWDQCISVPSVIPPLQRTVRSFVDDQRNDPYARAILDLDRNVLDRIA